MVEGGRRQRVGDNVDGMEELGRATISDTESCTCKPKAGKSVNAILEHRRGPTNYTAPEE